MLILVLPRTQKIVGGKISGSRAEIVYASELSGFKSVRIQSSHFKFRIQNLRRHDQIGKFSFRIRPLVCKRQNQSGSKIFRIRHESGTISSTVNLLLGVTIDFQKSPSLGFIWRARRSTSRDFAARGRPLGGQKRLAPLARRSTCSKSRVTILLTKFAFHK